MANPPLIKAEPVEIRTLGLNERWIQDRIAENPVQLGLGDVYLKDRERRHPNAGRLDLLLQDSDELNRFEVELQLGETNEAHIIRTIEYWDIERRRYPQYEHTAVLIAERVNARFLNVISLFNGQIPLIAIQMNALKLPDGIALVFTKVLDTFPRGLVDEDEETAETADRAYWEKRSTETLKIADRLLALAKPYAPSIELNYLKGYVGVRVNGNVQNFFNVSRKRTDARFSWRAPQSEETDMEIETSGLDFLGYQRWGAYTVRLTSKELDQQQQLIAKWLKTAFDHFCA